MKTNSLFNYVEILSGFILFSFLIISPQVDATSTLTNEGRVGFEVTDEGTTPIDPEAPEQELEIDGPILATKGPLRFDYVPVFSFGNQRISSEDQEYYADAIPLKGGDDFRANYVQVTDHRGSAAGWRVTLKQENEFTSKESKQPLKGAYLSFDNQWTSSPQEELGGPVIFKETIQLTAIGTSYPIATAEKGTGAGTWTISFGSAHEHQKMKNTLIDRNSSEKELGGRTLSKKNSSVRLFVPGNTEKKQEFYSTVLTWTLSEI